VDAKNLQRYKRMLQAKLDELSATKSAKPIVLGEDGRLGDVIDQANSENEAELLIRVRQTDIRLLRAIKDALVRVNQNKYGVCATCREPISAARLNAVPWTRHCRTCKENQRT
jgi:RNA polymerase-binding protein DksA